MTISKEITLAVDRLYYIVDILASKLCSMDSYWKKCFPCANMGRCCIGVDVPIYKAEWILISRFLSKLSHDDIEQIQKNLKENIMCPFRLPCKCAIHTVRPLYCRVTPYMAVYHEGDTEIEVMYPAANCTFVRQHCTRTSGSPSQSFESLGGRYFIVLSEAIYKSQDMKVLKSAGKEKYLSELLTFII